MFDGGELRLVLLKLIAEQPRHGYDLIREIEERTGGAYAPSPGVVYPTLTMLDDMGLIEEQKTEGAKKLFAITDAGTRAPRPSERKRSRRCSPASTSSARRRERTSGGSDPRAMGNLHDGAAAAARARARSIRDMLHEVAADPRRGRAEDRAAVG